MFPFITKLGYKKGVKDKSQNSRKNSIKKRLRKI